MSNQMDVYDALPAPWRAICQDFALGANTAVDMIRSGVEPYEARHSLSAAHAAREHNRLHRPAKLELRTAELNLLQRANLAPVKIKNKSIEQHWAHLLRHHRLIERQTGQWWAITMAGRSQLALHVQ